MKRKIIKAIGIALLASTTALWPAEAIAMPFAIGTFFLPLIVSSPVFFLGPAAISAVAMGIGYAAVIGAALLLQYALIPRPRPPKPEDVQTNFRQNTPTRTALYGQGLLGGPWVFGGTQGGFFHRVLALSSRTLHAIDQIWVDDIKNVNIDGNGYVTNNPYGSTGGGQWIRVQTRRGLTTETPYSALVSAFSGWTTNHRGDGIASIYTRFTGPSPEDIQKLFPNGINTLIRARCRGVEVWNPVNNTTGYSDNAARVILDYMRNKDGFRIPDSLLLTPLALAGWQQAVNDCNDAIPLAAGGTEPRYRIWGTYNFQERPADVLTRFMQACNGRIKPTADGGFHLEVGKWRDPEVTIDSSMITGFQGLARGRDIMQTANVVYSQFTSAEHEYQSTDAQPWVNEADVAERGEISISPDFLNAPSHGQCRRLMKIESYRANPAEIGTIMCKKAAIIAYGERFININYPEMDLIGTFEVLDFQFIFGEHAILRGCSIKVQSISAAAYAWNAATEEGTPGSISNPPTEDPFEAPDFTLTMQAGGQALIEWAKPENEAWIAVEIQHENLTNPDGTTTLPPLDIEDEAHTITGLTEDDEYRFRIRFRGNVSATTWSVWKSGTALS